MAKLGPDDEMMARFLGLAAAAVINAGLGTSSLMIIRTAEEYTDYLLEVFEEGENARSKKD